MGWIGFYCKLEYILFDLLIFIELEIVLIFWFVCKGGLKLKSKISLRVVKK